MANDDSNSEQHSRGTIPLDESDIEEIPEFPDFPDREEFVKTQEMDSPEQLQELKASTRPMQPTLDQVTQRYDVPEELLDAASRSTEFEIFDEWGEFLAHVDHRGRITLPSRTHTYLRGKKVRVRFRLEWEEIGDDED